MGLYLTFHVPTEGEAEESDSNNEADPVVFSDVPSSIPLFGELEIEAPTEGGSPTMVTRTSPSNLHGLEVRVIEAAQSPASDI